MSLYASKILLASDTKSERDAIGRTLEAANLVPILTSDAQACFEKIATARPQLVIIDLQWPGTANVELCQALRASQIRLPIIVLSPIADELEKVLLLEVGADDYIVKPFGFRELLARIRALLRRTYDSTNTHRFADVAVDLANRTVMKRGEEVKLTRAEYNLLAYFLQNPGRCVTRDMILNSVWGYDFYPTTRTVDAHVVRLRQKLEPDHKAVRHFQTVHGVGYRFVPHDDRATGLVENRPARSGFATPC